MRGLPFLLLAVPLLSACRPDPSVTGAVRADIAYQGFPPGCLKLSAVDEASPDKHMEVELPLSSLDRSGSRTIAVFRGQGWSGKLLLTASAFEKSCQGQLVARQAAHVVVPSLDVATVPFSLAALDADGDGYVSNAGPLPGSDCDDHHDAIHPGQPELCDALDNDCDGVVDNGFLLKDWFRDADGDGYGDPRAVLHACAEPASGYVRNGDDCDDHSAYVHPKPGGETFCDGIDDDCAHGVDDTFNVGLACTQAPDCAGRLSCAPGPQAATTVCAAPPPQTYFLDLDGDGHGGATTVSSCLPPGAGARATSDDCDDGSPFTRAGAPELCDGRDNDCDGVVDNPGTCAAGAVWAPRSDTGAGDFHAVATFGLGKAWLAGSGGALRLRNGSGGFVSFDGACAGDWEAAWAAPDGQVYLAGKAGGLASHPLAGACADQFTTAAGAELHALSGTVGPDGKPALFAVGESGFAYSWSPPDAPAALPQAGTTRLLGASALSATRLLAVGEDPGPTPRILRFDGAGWTSDALPSGLPALSALRSVHAVNDMLAYAVGDNGILLQYDGTRWTRRPPPVVGPTQPTLTRVVAFGTSDVYVSASDGKVRRFDGSAWTELSPSLPPLRDLAVPRPDEVWAIGAQGQVLHWPEGAP